MAQLLNEAALNVCAGMEQVPADGTEQGTVGALAESPGKRARSGSLRSLLRPFSPNSRPDSVDSGASDLRAERPRSELLEVNLEESGGSVLRNPAESWLRKAYSITSPRPTDQDDMSTVDNPSSAGVCAHKMIKYCESHSDFVSGSRTSFLGEGTLADCIVPQKTMYSPQKKCIVKAFTGDVNTLHCKVSFPASLCMQMCGAAWQTQHQMRSQIRTRAWL